MQNHMLWECAPAQSLFIIKLLILNVPVNTEYIGNIIYSLAQSASLNSSNS